MERRTCRRRRYNGISEELAGLKQDKGGFEIKILPKKGRAVITQIGRVKGEFLLCYVGELITGEEGDRREAKEQTGFRYFFNWINPMTKKRSALCVDATDEPDPKSKCQLGRLVNHSRGKEQNGKMTAKTVDGKPVLCLYAIKAIPAKSEILYDYGLPQGHNWNTPYYSQLIRRMQEDLKKHTDTPKVQVHVDGEQKQDKLKGHAGSKNGVGVVSEHMSEDKLEHMEHMEHMSEDKSQHLSEHMSEETSEHTEVAFENTEQMSEDKLDHTSKERSACQLSCDLIEGVYTEPEIAGHASSKNGVGVVSEHMAEDTLEHMEHMSEDKSEHLSEHMSEETSEHTEVAFENTEQMSEDKLDHTSKERSACQLSCDLIEGVYTEPEIAGHASSKNGVGVVSEHMAEDTLEHMEHMSEDKSEHLSEHMSEDKSQHLSEHISEDTLDHMEHMSEDKSQHLSEHISEDTLEHMSEDKSQHLSEHMSEDKSQHLSEHISEDTLDHMEHMSEDKSQHLSEHISEDTLEHMSEDKSQHLSEHMSEDKSQHLSEHISEDTLDHMEHMSEDKSEHSSEHIGLSEDMSEHKSETMSKETSEYISEDKLEHSSENMSEEHAEGVFENTEQMSEDKLDHTSKERSACQLLCGMIEEVYTEPEIAGHASSKNGVGVVSEHMAEDTLEHMEHMSEDKSEHLLEHIHVSEDMSEHKSEHMPEKTLEHISEDQSENSSEHMSEDMSEHTEHMSKDKSDHTSKDMIELVYTEPEIAGSFSEEANSGNEEVSDQTLSSIILPGSDSAGILSSEKECDQGSNGDKSYQPSIVSDSEDSDNSMVFPVVQRVKALVDMGKNAKMEFLSQNEQESNTEKDCVKKQGKQARNEKAGVSETYKKPYRFCIFCKKYQSKLSNHIANKHKDNNRVQRALSLPRGERISALDVFKKEGILHVNKLQARQNDPKYERERSVPKTEGELVTCGECRGFYAKKYMKRHKKLCQRKTESATISADVPANLLQAKDDYGDDFVLNVLSRFRINDDAGKLCTKDPCLLEIGKRLWSKQKRKQDKQVEVRKSVMADMRRLASLYIELKNTEETLGNLTVKKGNVSDLFQRSNFRHLEEAVENFTRRGESDMGVKAGLKQALLYLLKSACKIVKALYLMDDDDDEAANIDKFLAVLHLSQNAMFGDATYLLNKQRQEKLRRPQEQPEEEDIAKLKKHTVKRMSELAQDEFSFLDSHGFVELRDCVVARLTLYNARRGGEPSRLPLSSWLDADKGAWLDKYQMDNLDPLDKALAQKLKVGYHTGKGLHFVPILFPEDTHVALRKLASKEVRLNAGVSEDNNYLFPGTNDSDGHVSGWHAVHRVCQQLTLLNKETLTATKNRHRISVLFALSDVPEKERSYIFKHLGHSETTNINIYQAPLAVKEITVVGRRLETMDAGGLGTGFGAQPQQQQQQQHQQQQQQQESSDVTCSPACDKVQDHDESSDIPCSQACNEVQDDDSSTPIQVPVARCRKYTYWRKGQDEDIVRKRFKSYLDGTSQKRLPGKEEVVAFLEEEKLPYAWKTVHTKVMNEVYKRERLSKKRLTTM